MGRIGKLFAVGVLACWLPLGAIAETPATPGTAATTTPAEPGAAPDAQAGEPAVAEEKPEQIETYAGTIEKVMAEAIVLRRAGQPTDPAAPALMLFRGKLGVPVRGQGKQSWLALRRGDIVMVTYAKGPPHRAIKVHVLPKPVNPLVAAARGVDTTGPRTRSFVGYIKKKDGDDLIVMSPTAPPPARRPAEIKAFIRREDTRVEVLRDSWDDLRKGDRVKIAFQKGNPRPIDLVQVIRRGGEEPLPPGVATRLFHPDYDASVKDVDGIGETGPVPVTYKRVQPSNQIKLRKNKK